MKKLTAGGEIDAWCTRCKMDLGHRIVAMVGPLPKRVVCLTCDSQHNYRAAKSNGVTPAGAAAPRAAASRTSGRPGRASAGAKRPTAAARVEQRWEELVGDRPQATFKRYGVSSRFSAGELIAHPKFGPGAVVMVLEDGKISVVFRDAERTLAHGRQA